MGAPVEVWPVTRARTPEDIFRHCMPLFGAAFLRRIFLILDKAIGLGLPIILPMAGPITVSNQHRSWVNPLLETGWIAYITVTDAICYHDGHDSLARFKKRPIREVAMRGRDKEYGKRGVIRVTDGGFPEQILFDQDAMITAFLRQPELQRKMTGTEFRNLLGKYYARQEEANGVEPGLLSTCWRNGIPVFVGAPGDGSVFLNQVKLWVAHRLGKIEHKFELDIEGEVFESCAYHYWGLTASDARALAIFILGGGVPKNFSLQPEPTLSQIFLLPNIRGYEVDVQIVGGAEENGALSTCPATEAHTWGKVSAEALDSRVESYSSDYTTHVPWIVWALLDKRRRFQELREQIGPRKLFQRHPEARGYLREKGQLRLFDRRDELNQKLMERLGRPKQMRRLMRTFSFPLASPAR